MTRYEQDNGVSAGLAQNPALDFLKVGQDTLRTSEQAARDRLSKIQGIVSAAIYQGSQISGSLGTVNPIHEIKDAGDKLNELATKTAGNLESGGDTFYRHTVMEGLDGVKKKYQDTENALNAEAEAFRKWCDDLKGAPQKIFDNATKPLENTEKDIKKEFHDTKEDIKKEIDKTVTSLTDTAKTAITGVVVVVLIIAAVILFAGKGVKKR